MKQIALELFLHIAGIGSASGLVLGGSDLYLISDNSTFLYRYDTDSKKLETISLVDAPQANIAKKDKPDFEAITQKDGKLYLIGSGSTEKRNEMASFDIDKKSVSRQDLKPLYDRFQSHANLAKDQLNIEGLVFDGSQILFFQRGNGEMQNNGVFVTDGFDATKANIRYIPVALPGIDGIASSFTDATMADGRIFFLASAENSASTYHDGEVAGSLIGELNPETGSVIGYKIIEGKHKFEGLTAYSVDKNNITFLVCEDNDTEHSESDIYKLKVDF